MEAKEEKYIQEIIKPVAEVFYRCMICGNIFHRSKQLARDCVESHRERINDFMKRR